MSPREMPNVATLRRRALPAETEHRRAVGGRIRQARNDRDLTQQQLADAMACARSTVAHQEVGNRAVQSYDLLRYATALRVRPGWLLTGEGGLGGA